MSGDLISKVGLIKRGCDGREATVFTDGDPRDGDIRWAEVRALPPPRFEVGIELYLDSAKKVRLPFTELAWLLPDRTGVLVIFRSGKYVNPDGSDVFPAPNNAAIYNADGSLRFQLILDSGDRIEAVHSGAMPPKFKDKMGVVVATHPEAPPEWVYAVDPEKPALIRTGQWVRW